MKKFPCGICKNTVAANHNAVCCDICNKWVHGYCNITRYCYRKLQKDEIPWYCKIYLGQAMLFSNLISHQLEAFMLGKLITFPKLIQSDNQLVFPNDDTENIPKNQYLTPNDFYEIQNTTKSKQVYIHLNISSISYHIDDLVSLITNCKTKPKVIGISESRMRTGRPSPFQVSILIIIFMNILLLNHENEAPN